MKEHNLVDPPGEPPDAQDSDQAGTPAISFQFAPNRLEGRDAHVQSTLAVDDMKALTDLIRRYAEMGKRRFVRVNVALLQVPVVGAVRGRIHFDRRAAYGAAAVVVGIQRRHRS